MFSPDPWLGSSCLPHPLDVYKRQDKEGEHQTNLSWDAMAEILENLCSFMETVIKLSMMHDIYISPRADGELGCWKFSSILDLSLIHIYFQFQKVLAIKTSPVSFLNYLHPLTQNCIISTLNN